MIGDNRNVLNAGKRSELPRTHNIPNGKPRLRIQRKHYLIPNQRHYETLFLFVRLYGV